MSSAANHTNPIFNDEDAARAHFEKVRWPNGPECPHCGVVGEATLMKGKTTRPGLYNCRACRKPFSATMGTLFEKSHIPLHKWLYAIHLMCESKKGISAHQLFRSLGFGSYRTAWFMAHRIREGMRTGALAPFGGTGTPVEVDETYIGFDPEKKVRKGGYSHKLKILALVDRESGKSRAMVMDTMSKDEVHPILRENIAKEARLMTDEFVLYRNIGKEFATHEVVGHTKGEYVRGEAHTNTVEGYFSVFKRGMKGVYQKASKKHLHRYVAEFDFRYSNRIALGVDDTARAAEAVKGTVGKRLTYKKSHSGAQA